MKNILFLVSFSFVISCENTNSQIIENIGAEKFQKLICQEDGIIIDVRTLQEFSSGHIKDATNIDFYADDFTDKLKVVRKDVPIYVYCRSGGRSSLAASKMEKLGFTKVYNLVGGIGAWDSANYTTIKSKDRKQSIQPTFTVAEIGNVLRTNELVLIDFSAQWCVPCRKMKPVIQEIQKENSNIKVLFIDADVNKELIKQYQIKGVPAFVVFKNAKEVFRHVGIISKKELLKTIK
ncbi:MAG: thioredoxin domain-containing protein [Bacteroidota bacterium]|nr:thioredoxin domain-containing protein [Bacteroidota bacterium]